MIDKKHFETLFKVGDEIQSGGPASHKNAARLEIQSIEDDRVRYRSIRNATRRHIDYGYLQLIVDAFQDRKQDESIEKFVNRILTRAGHKKDRTNENYSYGIARAYLQRSGSRTDRIEFLRQGPPATDEEELPATRQGFHSSPTVRKTIEEHAMDLARKHFEALGYTVETHGKPFDLLCTLGAEVLYVEVKGTQGSGAEILLTRGEVRFHRDNHANMALFVVSEVEVLADETASGGRLMLQNPWVLNEDELTPYAFRYRV